MWSTVNFNIEHALDCRFGDLIVAGIMRFVMLLMTLLLWFGHLLCVMDLMANLMYVLIADLCVYGVWQLQTDALFDIRVVDTDVQSYCLPVLYCVTHSRG